MKINPALAPRASCILSYKYTVKVILCTQVQALRGQ
jgi:hypothetical protein